MAGLLQGAVVRALLRLESVRCARRARFRRGGQRAAKMDFSIGMKSVGAITRRSLRKVKRLAPALCDRTRNYSGSDTPLAH